MPNEVFTKARESNKGKSIFLKMIYVMNGLTRGEAFQFPMPLFRIVKSTKFHHSNRRAATSFDFQISAIIWKKVFIETFFFMVYVVCQLISRPSVYARQCINAPKETYKKTVRLVKINMAFLCVLFRFCVCVFVISSSLFFFSAEKPYLLKEERRKKTNGINGINYLILWSTKIEVNFSMARAHCNH